MLRAQVISQQNTRTENQNVVTMCHIKNILKTRQKLKISKISDIVEKISDIYPIYINDIYRRYISSQPCTPQINSTISKLLVTGGKKNILRDCSEPVDMDDFGCTVRQVE